MSPDDATAAAIAQVERESWPKFRVHNDGQLPIGSGQRLVRANVGRKWVRILETNHSRAKRVRRELWDQRRPQPIEPPPAQPAPEQAAPRSLKSLATEIGREHGAVVESARTGIVHAMRCGDLLNEAKQQMPHGQWLDWIKANTPLSPRTAQTYMRLADHRAELTEPKAQLSAHLPKTIDAALEQLATHISTAAPPTEHASETSTEHAEPQRERELNTDAESDRKITEAKTDARNEEAPESDSLAQFRRALGEVLAATTMLAVALDLVPGPARVPLADRIRHVSRQLDRVASHLRSTAP